MPYAVATIPGTTDYGGPLPGMTPCPPGYHISGCPMGPPSSVVSLYPPGKLVNIRGAWLFPNETPCNCMPNPTVTAAATTAVATAVKFNWGLYLGLGLAGFIVFKVATTP